MCRHRPIHGWTPRLSSKGPLAFERLVSSIVEDDLIVHGGAFRVFGRNPSMTIAAIATTLK